MWQPQSRVENSVVVHQECLSRRLFLPSRRRWIDTYLALSRQCQWTRLESATNCCSMRCCYFSQIQYPLLVCTWPLVWNLNLDWPNLTLLFQNYYFLLTYLLFPKKFPNNVRRPTLGQVWNFNTFQTLNYSNSSKFCVIPFVSCFCVCLYCCSPCSYLGGIHALFLPWGSPFGQSYLYTFIQLWVGICNKLQAYTTIYIHMYI